MTVAPPPYKSEELIRHWRKSFPYKPSGKGRIDSLGRSEAGLVYCHISDGEFFESQILDPATARFFRNVKYIGRY